MKYIPSKEVPLADAPSRVNHQNKMELKGLDFTIYKLTPCMTLTQMSMIHAKQNKDATMQLLIQQLASRMAQVLKRGGPNPQGIGP